MAQPQARLPRHAPGPSPRRVALPAPSAATTTHLVGVLGVSHPIRVSGPRDEKIAAIANLQRGLVSRAQMVAAGISDDTVDRLTRKGHLHRRDRGVYAVGHTAPAQLADETAALLACGDHAVLSHHTAALIHRLIPHGDCQIHVTIRGRHGPSPRGVNVHRTKSLNRGDVQFTERLPLTSPIRTVFDLVAASDLATTERAVEEALTQRLASEQELRRRAADLNGQRAGTLVNAILDAHKEPGITKSKAERRFRHLLRAAQLPLPRTNVRIHGYEVDCYWPDLGVVVEVQGYQFHSGRRAFERDTRKAAKLAAAGLAISYVTWLQMENEPFAVVARTAQTLAVLQTRRAG